MVLGTASGTTSKLWSQRERRRADESDTQIDNKKSGQHPELLLFIDGRSAQAPCPHYSLPLTAKLHSQLV